MKYLTTAEVKNILRVSDMTIRRWVYSGELAAVKFGHTWRFKEEDVLDFVKRQETNTKYLLNSDGDYYIN